MKKLLFAQQSLSVVVLCLCISCSHFSFSQNPLVKMWDKRFGGIDAEGFYSIQQTSDGGFILGGISYSPISGDKTQNTWGSSDYWIVKTDSLGSKQWDKDFGGTSDDWLPSLQQTVDGGYILGGNSKSGIGGDKTQNTWSMDTADYWIVKTDSLGNKQWDKNFGGTNWEDLSSIQQTADGGYILGGTSASDISGDKTQNTWGTTSDYWIVKIDALGNKQWDKNFGGMGNDHLQSILQTSDGGYIFGGYSASNSSGDKTQNLWGFTDYWIVKTDSLGNKQWDKDFGGTDWQRPYSIQQTNDGGYILGGWSTSSISGDKTQDTNGDYDYWILKTDSLGNKQWDKDFGGSDRDEFRFVQQTNDGGYLLSGDSDSPISGNKTESNLGNKQTWLVKTDSLGNILWDKTAHTLIGGYQGLAIQTHENCNVIANNTSGGIGGG